LGLTTAKKEVLDFLDNLSSDSSDADSDEDDRNRPEEIIIEEPTSVEIFREKTIEDIIEEQRAKLAAEGKKGTPVTAESFAKWRAEKLAKKQAEAEARVKAESLKKKGGKGLCKFLQQFYLSNQLQLILFPHQPFCLERNSSVTMHHYLLMMTLLSIQPMIILSMLK
jgi:hypothetical protein